MTEPWKRIPLQNCGGAFYDRQAFYELPGSFLAELRQMASLLSCGDKISDDDRRDMAQRIQAVTDAYK
jgi:hypothetical protein